MVHPLPEGVKMRAVKRFAKYSNLTVEDPGTVCYLNGRTLVCVFDEATGTRALRDVPEEQPLTLKPGDRT
jgi:hypothetical protein